MTTPTNLDTMRIDKWLWAARFYKTRGLATEAIGGGKIHVDGQRVKPSKMVSTGSQISISKGGLRWSVTIAALCKQRRPAKEATLLYEESAQSAQERAQMVAERKLHPSQHTPKPNKRDRRQIRSFMNKD